MNDPTLIKAASLPENVRAILAVLEQDKQVGRTGRTLYLLLHAFGGTRKQSFPGASVLAKLMMVERQAIHRAVKELSVDAGLLAVHTKGSHVTVVVPDSFKQETLLLYGLVTGEKTELGDVPVQLPPPEPAAPPAAKRGGRTAKPKNQPAPPPPAPVQQVIPTPAVPVVPPPQQQAPTPPTGMPPQMPQIPQVPPIAQAVPVTISTPQSAPIESQPEESVEIVKMSVEVAEWCCASLENMTNYLCFGPQAMVTKNTSTLRPTKINWRTALKSDGQADPERWSPQQFMGFYWYRISRYRAVAGLPLTLPGKDFGRVGREISALLIKLGGKVAVYHFIDTLTAYFDLVKYHLGGTFGASQVLDETTLSKQQIVGAVHTIQQMDNATITQLMNQISQPQD